VAAVALRGLFARAAGVSGKDALIIVATLGALPIWGWLVTQWSVSPAAGVLILGTWLQGCLFGIWAALVVLSPQAAQGCETNSWPWIGLGAFGALATAVCLWGLWHHFAVRPLQIERLTEAWNLTHDETYLALLHNVMEGRLRSTLGDPNHLGFLAAMGATALLGCLLFLTLSPTRRITLCLGVVILIVALSLSGSRAGVLSLLAGGAVLGFGAVSCRRSRVSRVAVSLTILAALLGVCALFAVPALQARFTNLSTVRERLGYWEIAWTLFAASPLTGEGVGSFVTWYPSLRLPGQGEAQLAHSLPLQLMAETGLIGLSLFVLPLALTVWISRQGLPGPGWAFGAVLTAIGVNSLVGHSIYYRELWVDAMGVLGLFLGWRLATRGSAPSGGGWAWVPATLVFAAAVALIWPSDLHHARAEVLNEAADYALSEGRFTDAIMLSNELELAEPNSDLWHVRSAARLMALAGTGATSSESLLSEAARHLGAAEALNPMRPSTQASLARLHQMRGDTDAAIRAHRRAIALHPAEPIHRVELAQTLREKGDLEGAEQEARAALTLDTNSYHTLMALAEILLERGKLDEARECAHAASESSDLNRTRAAPWQLLARIEQAAGNAEAARAAADEALARDPNNAALRGWRRRLDSL
jgi:O-antigen ligase